jgi:hypothetical protein
VFRPILSHIEYKPCYPPADQTTASELWGKLSLKPLGASKTKYLGYLIIVSYIGCFSTDIKNKFLPYKGRRSNQNSEQTFHLDTQIIWEEEKPRYKHQDPYFSTFIQLQKSQEVQEV